VQPFLIVMAVAACVTALAVGPMRRLAIRFGAVAEPTDRSVHEAPTPILGGGALFVGLLVALGVAALLPAFRPVFASPANIVGVLVAAFVIWLTGLVDDLRDVSAPAKVAGMVLAGSILTLVGVTIIYFRVPFLGFTVLPADLSALVTVLWVVGLANAVNLIDGLDGLAAGIVAIAAGSFFLYGFKLLDAGVLDASNIGPLLAVVTAGICIGFLPANFHPASIFMGDSGALLLGLLLAASTVAVGGQSDDPFSGQAWFFFAPLILPLFILGVPLIDTVFAVIRRATRRTGVATADKEHLHHRLMEMGHGHRRAVVILWAWTALLSGFVLVPVFTNRGNGIVPVGLLALGLLLFTLLAPRWIRKGDAIDRSETDAEDSAVGQAQVGDDPANESANTSSTTEGNDRPDLDSGSASQR